METNNLQTGYFARPADRNNRAKWTKVHIVNNGNAAICGYTPHQTMKFQWNAHGVHLPYVECDKCKAALKTFFTVERREPKNGKTYYYAKFYESAFGLNIKDLIKNCDRPLESFSLANDWGKQCAKDFNKFMNKVTKEDRLNMTPSILSAKQLWDLPLSSLDTIAQRMRAKKVLFDNMKKQGWHEVLFNEGKPNHSSALIDSVVDAMIEFKSSK